MGAIPFKRVLLIVGLVALILFIVGGTTFASKAISPFTARQLVACEVTMKNNMLSAPAIQSMDCQMRNACMMAVAVPSLKFIVPTDTVHAQMVTSGGDTSATEKYVITERLLTDSSVTRELRVCTGDIAGNIIVKDSYGNVIVTQPWQVEP